MLRSFLVICAMNLAAIAAVQEHSLDAIFAPGRAVCRHCDLAAAGRASARITVWRGYEATGFELTPPPVTDVSAFASLRFEVDNPYPEPISIFVRLSNVPSHPRAETYTGGTFDGYVIGPGRSPVEISLEKMHSPDGRPVNAARIAWLGIYFQPLFVRDGLELMFTRDKTLLLSNPRLSAASAKPQKQPYADLLFRETELSVRSLRAETEKALEELNAEIAKAKARGIETAYAEIYPYVARMAFQKRLVAFWQDRATEQRRALTFLLEDAREARRQLAASAVGHAASHTVPPLPDYSELKIRDGYYRLGHNPSLIFAMLYNHDSPLNRWFASNETDYISSLVAGGDRFNVEKQPIWEAYQKYPDTHRVGWDHANAFIRDSDSWEVLGPPVIICLESPDTREAISKSIEEYERAHTGDRSHLVHNMDFEYAYVCYCERTRQMWARWLERKHSSIAKANAIYGASYESFDKVPMPRPEHAVQNRALWFDWSSFNLYRFIEQIRWTKEQVRRYEPTKPLTVGSPYYSFDPAFWTGVDEEELTDAGVTDVVLEENYALDTLMPEYLHALAGSQPVEDFEFHGVLHQVLPSFLHGDAAICMWWWNDDKHWTPNEPINEWTTSFPQSYTIPLSDLAKAMRDALDVRRLGREISALGSAPRPVALLYSKSSMLQQPPFESAEIGTFPYLSSLRRLYNASQSAGLYVGLTTEKKILAGDLASRKLLVLTAAEFMPRPVVEAILQWVDSGGTLVVSPDSLLADEYARPSDTLARLGLRLRRHEPAPLPHGEKVVTAYNVAELPHMPFTLRGDHLEAIGARQVLECPSAQVAARFPDGAPAVVQLQHHRGRIYWLASELEPASWRRFLTLVGKESGLDSGLRLSSSPAEAIDQIEYRVTTLDGRRIAYLCNNSDRDASLVLQPAFASHGLLDLRAAKSLDNVRLALPARETALVEFK